MTERPFAVQRGSALGRGPVEPLSPQAWQRVESAVFARLDSALPWSLAEQPLHSYAAPRADRSLRLHWGTSVGLALASAAAAASVLHYTRPAPRVEAGPPAELAMPAPPAPAQPVVERPPSAIERSRTAIEPASPRAAAEADPPAVGSARALPAGAAPAPAVPLARASVHRPAPERAPSSDRERLFARAASLESADAPLALALYLSLASGDDDWAANALYAAARLEIDRGLHDAGAEHLREYLARFPRGENAVDVRGLRQRIGIEPE